MLRVELEAGEAVIAEAGKIHLRAGNSTLRVDRVDRVKERWNFDEHEKKSGGRRARWPMVGR